MRMIRWRKHEEPARSTTLFQGYDIVKQKVSTSAGKQPDFFGISKSDSRTILKIASTN